MTVEAEIKDGSIFFYENGKLSCMYKVEWALKDLRWAMEHQPGCMTEEDYKGCLPEPEPEHMIKPRDNAQMLKAIGYRMEGHSHCPWCKHH
jgi:hypothetical protein